MNTLNTHTVALSTGVFLGGFHLVWSLLVLLGVGQYLLNFVYWAHMIHLPIIVGPFDATASITLVVMTFVFGYVFGWVFAYVFNKLHRTA